MLPRRRVTWFVVAALATGLLAACGQDDSPRLQKAPGKPAPGTHRVVCPVKSAHGKVRLALDLPRGFVHGLPDAYTKFGGCAWYRPVKVPDDSNFDGDPNTQDTYDSDVLLIVGPVGKHDSVDAYYDENKPDAVDGNNPAGDDSILHLKRAKDVAALGSTTGERLSFLCYCDGQNLIHRYAEADGILLRWDSDLAIEKETDRQLRGVLASVGTVD